MQLNRIMLAAPKSGSGKTMLTCALLQALKNRNIRVFSYKCGPDYIDPMFHQRVIGVPSKNLDTFFTGEEETRRLLCHDRKDGEFAVVEGVMGLFDGLGGTKEVGSSYHLAAVTKTPVILVVDAKGMGRSVIPLLAGFLAYDKEKLIRGVILNRMSKRYYDIIKPLIEEELHIRVLGYFPENKELCIESRHLGLKMPQEMQNLKEKLQISSKELEKTVDVGEILRLAANAEELACLADGISGQIEEEKEKPMIAVAKDEAFCFYYEDNIRLLREYGAKIEFFSPLHDKALPAKCAGILIGGGYPELFAEQLSQNKTMLDAVRTAIQSGMPSVAECGGFMYLHEELEDHEQTCYTMAKVIPGRCHNTGKLVRFGYIEIEEESQNFLESAGRIRGHEFHYYDSTDNGNGCQAMKPVTGKKYSCIWQGENHWWGFPHLYYPSNPRFAENFVKKARDYKKQH